MFKVCLVSWPFFLMLLMLGSLNAHLGLVVGSLGCHEAEREALLKFRHSLSDTKNQLSSWVGKDCCRWEGIRCDNVTSYVDHLNVHPYFYPDFLFNQWTISAPKLDHSLVVLSRLNYLDLSCIDFEGSQIPGFIGSFKHLRYLNLSYSNFGGVIPSQLSNLTRLHTLDLSTIMLFGDTLSSDLHWVSRLFNLQYLYISGVRISSFTNSEKLLNMPSLLGLQISGCQLNVSNFLSLFSNITLLSTMQHLDLSFNFFQGSFPAFVVNMTSLRYLDLSENQLNGLIPLGLRTVSKLEHLDLSYNYLEGPLYHVLTNMTFLTYLDLSSNSLIGSIPLCIRNMGKLQNLDLRWNEFSQVEGGVIMGILGNLCSLKSLDLSGNPIVGDIGAHHNLSNCVTYDLEELDLSVNMIGGILPSWLGDFKRLRHLDVGSNAIEGPIPVSIGRLSYLEYLELSFNKFTGTIPEGLGQCMSLVNIDLRSNNLQGVVFESLFANLSSLYYLGLSSNSLEVKLSSNWSPPFQLTNLYLASCKMKTQFPQWIWKQTKLLDLDLSDNMLSGKLDVLFPMEHLTLLNISHNQLMGLVPHFTSSLLFVIDLSYNLLSGPIIHEGPSTKNYDSVGTPVCRLPILKFLDLQRNNINGSIPDCWRNSSRLAYINLSSNKLSGIIPMSLGRPVLLQFLKLSNNLLCGSISQTVSSCQHLQILDLGENILSGNIPESWGAANHPTLQMLRLRGNQLGGVIPTTLCSLSRLQLVDLAHNSFTGPIPHCFGHLMAMDSPPSGNSAFGPGPGFVDILDFDPREESAMVVLKGAEFQYTSTLKYVVNLDLSCNALVGSIPDGITSLTGLIGLNLSHNHLTGSIPKKIGQMTSLESLDLSNNHLSGTIPSSVSDISSLSSINVSNNELHGEIPTGNQLQTLTDPSSYEGNPGLCGDPLPNKCKISSSHNQLQQEQEEDDDLMKNPLFYLVIISGLATGFWGVVGSLLLKDMFKFPLFQLVGYVADYLYMQALVRVNRFRN